MNVMATYRDTYSAHVSFNNFTLFQDNAVYRVINNANETPRNTCGKCCHYTCTCEFMC